MKINRDFFDHPMVPDYVLCKASRERIGILQCTEKSMEMKMNDLDEISFTTYLYMNNERNPHYDSVDLMKYILLPGTGFFAITSVNIESEDTEFECKRVTAKSSECLLAQKYLEEFTINMGTLESIDGVQLYNLRDKSRSLLHLVLEKCPDWQIGHIDASLMTMQRSFEISRQDIYSFINTDIAAAFECAFRFDTLNNMIHVYGQEQIGKDTNIHISYGNLLKNTSLSCTTDHIKTCLTITGSDDLTVREINLGYDRIYNFNYYYSTDYMSKGLYSAYGRWTALRKEKLPAYSSLLSRYQDYYKQINYLTHEKMPSTEGSTSWTEYGLQPLKEQLAAYEQRQAVSMKAGHGEPASAYYQTEYLPLYNTVQSIQAQLKVLESQLKTLQSQQSAVSRQMGDIVSALSMESNFTAEELKELTAFIREEELNSSNYVVTDSMTDEEKFEMLSDLLKFGENELARVSVPQLTFSADLANLLAIPEFEPFYGEFEPGNAIWVTLRDDFSIKAKLLSVHVNFYDPSDFSVTFGNVVRKAKTRYFDVAGILTSAQNASTSVSFNASCWSQAAKDTSAIGQILEDGLLAAGKYLKNGDDSEMVIDSRGIFVNTTSGKYAGKDSIFAGGGRILFTDDNWKTVSMSVGRADVTIGGKTESRFGTFADFVIAGYVGGSLLEGDDIIGGTLKSSNYVPGRTGTLINLNSGTFEFNAGNETKLALDTGGALTLKGTVKAEEGWIGGKDAFIIKSGKLYSGKDSISSNANGVYIGTDGIALGVGSTLKMTSDGTIYAEKGYLGGTNGFVLEKNKIYNGKSSISSTANGIYLGTDGIALGANNVFTVTSQGVLTARSGTIGGAAISADSIRASNNNWWINANGTASFKNVFVSGVQSGSSFGSLNYAGGITSGNFNGNSYFGSSAANPFTGTTIPHIQTIAADYIKVNYLDAVNAKIGSLQAKDAEIANLVSTKASIEELNAVKVKVDTIASTYITAQTVKAEYMEVKNWTKAGYIRADKIDVGELDADKIAAKITGSAIIYCNLIHLSADYMTMQGHRLSFQQITQADGQRFMVLGQRL